MAAIDFITELFIRIDDILTEQELNEKHKQAKLYPSKVVTIAFMR